jgi:hypothetical protein
MEKITLVSELLEDVGCEHGNTESSARSAKDVRTLNELELLLASGGDGVVSWPG